jgi:hypothetical protein
MYGRVILKWMNLGFSEIIGHADWKILVLTEVSENFGLHEHRFEYLKSQYKMELKETPCEA